MSMVQSLSGIGELGHRTEDALVAYLKTKIEGKAYCAAAYLTDEPAEPYVVVRYTKTSTAGEQAYTQQRMVSAEILIATHAEDERGDAQEVLRKAREAHGALVTAAMEALYVADLHGILNEQGVPGIAFWMAYVGDETPGQKDGSLLCRIEMEIGATAQEEA